MKQRVFIVMICIVAGMVLLSCRNENRQTEELPQLRIGGAIYEPYYYKDIDGDYTGIDVELAREACKRLGYEPVFVEMDLDKRNVYLEDGTIDCMWNCLPMEDTAEECQWAGPYLYSRRVIVVPKDSTIKELADLGGKTLAVQASSTAETIFLDNIGKSIPDVDRLETFQAIGEVFTALRKGYVDAIAGHEGALLVYTKDYPEEYRYLNLSIHLSKLGVAFAKSADSQLVEELTTVLQEMTEDGTTGEILERYGLDVKRNIYGGED